MKSVVGTYEAPFARNAIYLARTAGANIAIATAQPPSTLFSKKQQRFLDHLGIDPYDHQFARKDLNFDDFRYRQYFLRKTVFEF